MKYYFLNCLIIITTLVGFTVTQANGFGIKLDKAVGDYIVNVDADAYSFLSGESASFVFQLWNKDRSELVDFDNVWVGLTHGQQENYGFGNLFGGLVGKPDWGGFRATYILPKAGNYNLTVRYGKITAKKLEGFEESFPETKTIAEASFPITVERSTGMGIQSSLGNSLVSGILGIIIGTMLISWLKRK